MKVRYDQIRNFRITKPKKKFVWTTESRKRQAFTFNEKPYHVQVVAIVINSKDHQSPPILHPYACIQNIEKGAEFQLYACNQEVRIPAPSSDLSREEKRILKKIGDKVRRLRVEQDITLYGVEDRGYKRYQHWQQVESGTKNITISTLYRISKVLGIHPSELLQDI